MTKDDVLGRVFCAALDALDGTGDAANVAQRAGYVESLASAMLSDAAAGPRPWPPRWAGDSTPLTMRVTGPHGLESETLLVVRP